MTTKGSIKILKTHNQKKRGNGEMQEPKGIVEAIDNLIYGYEHLCELLIFYSKIQKKIKNHRGSE